MRESSVGDVVVVTGAHEVETDARVVQCPEWERGAGASLRCGLGELDPDARPPSSCSRTGPDLSPEAIDRVIEVWRESAAEVVAATYGGQRLHPVLLARAVWERIPDEGARELPALLVPCDDLDPPGDVDFADDLPERFKPQTGEE